MQEPIPNQNKQSHQHQIRGGYTQNELIIINEINELSMSNKKNPQNFENKKTSNTEIRTSNNNRIMVTINK